MKRIFLFAAAVLCAFTGIFFAKRLPADTGGLTEKKYGAWSGVIRIWAEEGCGAAGWLNACAELFEKRNDGIYINVQTVSSEALGAYADSGINPPDIMVYSRGAVGDASMLSPITAAYPLRDGVYQDTCAVPVLLRPYIWIYDAAAYDVLPGDMYGVRAACAPEDAAALAALCSGLRPKEGEKVVLPGLDLGLGGDAEVTEAPREGVPCRVAADIIKEAPAELFAAGECEAFVGGIDDALRNEGCGAAATGEYAYAEDAVMLSIVRKADGRGEACRAYLDLLMSEGQALAARARAFPAAVGASAWAGDMLMAHVEEALTGKIWLTGTYDTGAVYLYIEGNISADEAVRRMTARRLSFGRRGVIICAESNEVYINVKGNTA